MRIGVYICHCGLNIANVINIDTLRKKTEELADVAIVTDIQFMCSDSGQESIIEDIKEHNIDRVVVAACSPRLHEQTFKGVLEKAGLNPHLLEIVNIREHVSWVHMDNPQMATQRRSIL